VYLHYEDDELEQMSVLCTHEIFKKSKIMVVKPVRWKNFIKVDLTKTGCDEAETPDSAQCTLAHSDAALGSMKSKR
jgi:hypothetical protein